MNADLLGRLGLRNAAEGIPAANPDAVLLADLTVAADLRNDRDQAYNNWNAPPAKRRGTKPDAKAAYMRAADAHRNIEAQITATAARTDEGAIAKLRHALEQVGDTPPGTMYALPASAMRDALVMIFGCALMEAKPLRGKPTRRLRGTS